MEGSLEYLGRIVRAEIVSVGPHSLFARLLPGQAASEALC
jgi:hypothetical protein